jgi:proline racemase/trans-L-3-hydroxyproline dehydratase
MEIKHAVEKAVTVAHPLEPQLQGIYGTIFTGPPSATGADLKNVTIFADAEVDRSPCGTGTCAVMAVLAEMGVLGPEQSFTHESIIGTTFRGRVVGEATVSTPSSDEASELTAIIPEIEGEAHITGENVFLIDPRDPLAFGFRL